jgi:hypothetical protein
VSDTEHGDRSDGERDRRRGRDGEGEHGRDDEREHERPAGRRREGARAILPSVSYLADLGLTLAVEVPIVVAVGQSIGVRLRRAASVAVLANLLTHPLLWFLVAPRLHDAWGLAGVAIAELAVVVVEAAVYRRGLDHGALAAWLAVLANSASLLAGVVAHHGLP